MSLDHQNSCVHLFSQNKMKNEEAKIGVPPPRFQTKIVTLTQHSLSFTEGTQAEHYSI